MAENVIIYADSRESSSSVVSILKKRCIVREKQLKSADYILSKEVAVERKTKEDFIQSIIDRRLFEQLERLKSTFSKPVLVIEGSHLLKNDRNIHPNALRGAVASVSIDFSVPIIWTESQLQTAEMLLSIAKREQLDMKKPVGVRGKRKFLSKNQQQLFIVSGLPNISDATAKKLLVHFRTPAAVFAASEAELQEVPGIGKKMAERIRSVLDRKFSRSILE